MEVFIVNSSVFLFVSFLVFLSWLNPSLKFSIYFWLHWVFVAVRAFSSWWAGLLLVTGLGLLIAVILLSQSTGCGPCGFQWSGLPGSGAQAQEMWQMGIVAPWRVGSRIRCQILLSCIGRRILYHWAERKPPSSKFLQLFFYNIFIVKVSLLLTETVRWEVCLYFQANSHLVVHPFPTYVKFHSCHKLNPYMCIWIDFWILKYLFRYLFILMLLYQCFVHHDFIVHLDIWDDLSPIHCFFCLFLFVCFCFLLLNVLCYSWVPCYFWGSVFCDLENHLVKFHRNPLRF